MKQPNAICSDSDGGVSIKTLEECQNAVPFIESMIPGISKQANIEDEEGFPKGCYACVSEYCDGIYFNTHESGSRYGGSREVCIAEGR